MLLVVTTGIFGGDGGCGDGSCDRRYGGGDSGMSGVSNAGSDGDAIHSDGGGIGDGGEDGWALMTMMAAALLLFLYLVF